jgi:hypothetical protein
VLLVSNATCTALYATSNTIQGGSLRCFVGWADSCPTIKGGVDNIAELVRQEVAVGLHSAGLVQVESS